MGNKVLKTLLLSASMTLAFASVAGAEYINSVDYNYETNMVEISGKDFNDYAGEYARIIVMKSDRTDESFVSGTDDDLMENQANVIIAEDGSFSYSFRLKSITKDGDYVAYITAGKSEREGTFTYARSITTIYDEIMATTNSEDFAKAVVKYSSSLILDDTVFAKLDDDENDTYKLKAAAIAFGEKAEIQKASSKRAGVELLKDAVIRAAYIEALNIGGKLDYVAPDGNFIDAKLLGLEDISETAYTLYTEKTTDDGKAKVLANIEKQNYTSVEQFLDGFVYEATIAAIKYSTVDGTSHVSTILADNNTRNGFDLSNYESLSSTKDVDVAIISGKEWKYDDIQALLDTEESTSTKDPESGGGGGGGSLNYGGTGTFSQNYSVTTTPETTTPEVTEGTFTDLADVEWAEEYIEGLAAAGVVSGRGDGIYAPLDNVTRAEFLMMLVKALGIDTTGATCDFPDVIAGEWYYEAVAAGTSFGLASGYGDGNFGTTDLITRQDAAVMLNNAITKSGKTLEEINESIDFADKADISDYAADDVDVLVKAGILSGSNGSFMPKSNTTRAEAAVMISKIMTAIGLEG